MRLFVVFALVAITSGIDPSTRNKRNPFEPDNRVPVDIPNDIDRLDDDWVRRDFGKLMRTTNGGKKEDGRSRGPETVSAGSSDVCMTPKCILTASSLLESIDERVDPCDNFYDFVCGRWIENAIIPDHESSHSTLGEISKANAFKVYKLLSDKKQMDSPVGQQLHDFYSSCMNLDSIEKLNYSPIFSQLDDLDIWPPILAGGGNTRADPDPEKVIESFLKNFMAESALFGLDLSRDPLASNSKQLLTIVQPQMTFPPMLYNPEIPAFWTVMKFYEKVQYTALTELRRGRSNLVVSDSELIRTIVKMLGVEIDFGRKLVSSLDSEEQWRMTFKNFTDLLSSKPDSKIDIGRVIRNVIKDLVGNEISDDDMVLVPHLEYFRDLSEVIDKHSSQDLLNYIVVSRLLKSLKFTTKFMRDLTTKFESIFTGAVSEPPRWETCVRMAISFFGAKASQLYSNDRDGLAIKTSSEELTNEIRASFEEILSENDWMDDATREKAIHKLQSIKAANVILGDSLDNEVVDAVYNGSPEMSNSSFFSNVLSMAKFWTKKEVRRLIEVPRILGDVDTLEFDSTLVNAMYSREMNSIWLPLGIQSLPVFENSRLKSLNFGSWGSIVGHELTHGFDNTGSRFDAEGNFKNWWSPETFQKFTDRNKCFIDHYSNYTFPILNEIPNYTGPTGVDGRKTLGENIADNGGIREAFRAYRNTIGESGEAGLPGLSKYSTDQLFFMSYARAWCETKTLGVLVAQLKADPHPPAMVRVLAVMKNSEDFQAAFNCPDKSPMVAHPRCRVW